EVKNGVLNGESRLAIETAGGSYTVTADGIAVKGADEATLFLTAGTNYVNYKDVSGNPAAVCQEALESVEGKTFEEIKQAHLQEYRGLYEQFSVDLGENKDSLPTDERLANFATSPDPSFVALYM